MRLFLLISALFLCSISAQACLNGETKELKNGRVIYTDHSDESFPIPEGYHFTSENLTPLAQNLQSLYNKTKDIEYLSDKGYVLIVQGKYQEAINLYLEIEKIKPNRYSTASNIGTAYELIGNNQKALEWIKKSIKINPNAHDGSEWIHVKILEAKIKGETYITSSFLLNTDFGVEEEPSTKLSQEALEKLQKELYFQLNERASFIKNKDKIMALLMFELGNIVYATNKSDYLTLELYKKSQEYGFSNSLLNKRSTFMKNSQNQRKFPEKNISEKDMNTIEKKEPIKQENTKSEGTNNLYIYLLGAVLLVGVTLFILRNKLKKKV
jgi:tetratricopeptide (TPR) repeat protein